MPESDYDYEVVAGITDDMDDDGQFVVVGVRPPLGGLERAGIEKLDDVCEVSDHHEGTDITFSSQKPSRIHSRHLVERYLKEQGYSVGIISTIVKIDYDNTDSIFMQMINQEANK